MIHTALSPPNPHIQLVTGHLFNSILKIKRLKTCFSSRTSGESTQVLKPRNWASPLTLSLSPLPSHQNLLN